MTTQIQNDKPDKKMTAKMTPKWQNKYFDFPVFAGRPKIFQMVDISNQFIWL